MATPVEPKKVVGGSFGQYMAEKRAEIMKEVAGKPATEVIKLGSQRFKALTDAERKVYEDKYSKAKEQYEKDLAAFIAAGGEKSERSSKKKRKAEAEGDEGGKKKRAKKWKDKTAPKKPAGGAFGCYLDKHRPEIMKECEGKPITAVTKMASERWKALSEDARKPYDQAYEEKKKAYEEAMKSYVPVAPPEGIEAPKSKAELKAEKKAAKEDEKKTKAEEKAEQKKAKEEEKAAKKDAKKSKPANGGLKKSVAAKLKAKPAASPEPDIPEAILAKAEKAGCKVNLIKLASRDDVKSAGKTAAQIFKALQDNDGLLHPAKRALLD